MRLSSSSLIGITLLLPGTANADDGVKVNYYSDTNCQNYMISVFPTVGQKGKCYDYQWTGQQSVGIAECNFNPMAWACQCEFYQEYGCTGTKVTKEYKPVNPNWCASNPGHGFKSMKCKIFSTGI
ncbi:hypothetical protein B0H66DRAFT_567497 [Apodospora peruviana]|uniref:Uncharacterized protein n=1 Tax=Apodospora peruviana TaxID=516989 RepID=A0AAE0HXT5_9PEZI|nr:hypothetical protein B0H66DRAFT_567497 [Apodospora peruviana]